MKKVFIKPGDYELVKKRDQLKTLLMMSLMTFVTGIVLLMFSQNSEVLNSMSLLPLLTLPLIALVAVPTYNATVREIKVRNLK